MNLNTLPVGRKPQPMVCPSCSTSIISRVDHKSTTRTHLVALVLCICLCWPCLLIPYCGKSCRNADHYCPNCNSYLGTYQL